MLEESPYKFLDYYDYTSRDHALFFGRERETQILLSDIVVRRLVVLFAKTGTGKTSLINAGVRPILDKRGYATFFVRMGEAPVEKVREAIIKQGNGESLNTPRLSLLLNHKAKEKPLVIFFDQFEEFFQLSRDSASKRKDFISEIALLNRDKSSRVHIVFSLREDFLYLMDEFRAEIPTIFHNDSNLRLRGLNSDQAQEAIQSPAEKWNVNIKDDLVEKLITDLSLTERLNEDQPLLPEDLEIDPTHLQIVCDTLWRKKAADPGWRRAPEAEITLDDYLTLGQGTDRTNIARQILNQRLAKEFERITSEKELKLLDLLLPKLRTKKRTKFVRHVAELAEELDTDESTLRALLEQLELWQLIRKSQQDDSIELSHDYLVRSLSDLRRRVRAIWPRRVLQEAMVKLGELGEEMLPEDLVNVTKNANVMVFGKTEAEFLFRAALANEIEMKFWFDQASRKDVKVWEILKEKIESKDVVQAFYVLDLLSELQTPQAFDLLKKALHTGRLTSHAIEALSHTGVSESATLLANKLDEPGFSREAEEALIRLSRSARNNELANTAKGILADYAKLKKARPGLRREVGTDDYSERSKRGSISTLAPPFALFYDRLRKGQIIPFLGAGASLAPREVSWDPHEPMVMPSGTELAQYLAAKSNFPQDEPISFVKVADYYAIVAGRNRLSSELHKIFDIDFPILPVHRFLAEISAPLAIVTTNYDDLIERAFIEAGRVFDVVIHPTNPSLGENILWRPHGSDRPKEISPSRLDLDLNDRTVIYKMSGSIDRVNPELDQYVVTEDDHIDFLTRLTKKRAMPAVFAEAFQTRPFLFMGFGLRDWHVRVVLNRMLKELRRTKGLKSWSIQNYPTRLEQVLLQARGVDVYDMEIEHFMKQLREGRG